MSVYRVSGTIETWRVEYYCSNVRRWIGWTVECTFK